MTTLKLKILFLLSLTDRFTLIYRPAVFGATPPETRRLINVDLETVKIDMIVMPSRAPSNSAQE